MNVLIACEESQRVCIEFRKKGHNAFSCDLLPCSGNHPEWHLQCNVLSILNNNWDLIIAHPPCTYLSVAGNSWFNVEKYGYNAKIRYDLRLNAVDFFMKFVFANCNKIAIENPIGIMSSYYKKPTQIIQPYMFGEKARKSTCLWLKNLPNLIPTNIVEPDIIKYKNGKGTDDPWHFNSINLSPDERRIFRSKTFSGIAKAMAEQWG